MARRAPDAERREHTGASNVWYPVDPIPPRVRGEHVAWFTTVNYVTPVLIGDVLT